MNFEVGIMRRSVSFYRGWTSVARGLIAVSLLLASGVCTTAICSARPEPSPALADPVSGTVVTIDPEARFQTIEGWGTSLAWWANIVGGFPDSYRKDYITKIFDPVNGLGLNIVRYNIGGGESAARRNALQMRARMPGFQPTRGTFDWDADANQRRILTEAVAQGVNIVEAFSCSPPYWMTKSGSVAGAKDGGDNLSPENYGLFADYLAEVVKHYRDSWGITFRTLEPMNEAVSPWWKFGGTQEGCHFSRENQPAFIQAVAASLASRNLPTVVSTSDEANIKDALASLVSYDAPTLAKLDQVNTHSYGGDYSVNDRLFLRRATKHAGKRLWMSEYGDNDATGITLSKTIVSDMKHLQPNAWIYWQAVDSAGVWGCLDNPEDGKTFGYTINQKYYVFGNYTKFVRPGYVMISASAPNSVAFYEDRTKTLVIVSTNAGTTPVDLTYDLSRFKATGSITPYVTSATLHLEKQNPITADGSGRFRSLLPPSSVSTFVVSAADMSGSIKAADTTIAAGSVASRFQPGSFYRLTSLCSNMVMSVRGAARAAGSYVVQEPPVPGRPDQDWCLEPDKSGYYKLVNRGSLSGADGTGGLVLGVSEAGMDQGNYTTIAADTGGKHQRWQLVYDGNGYYKLINANSLMNLDVYGQLTTADTPIDQCPDAGTTNQLWRIEPIAEPPAPKPAPKVPVKPKAPAKSKGKGGAKGNSKP